MAKILTPCGYVREQRIYWGPLEHDHFVVDFVQLDAKTVIELDGPYHRTNKSEEDDALRDATLNALGFRVIRIKHDQ
jgi:very-short-patch-repair endonuclease